MAAIEERQSSKGEKSYRAKIRVKGHPTQTATFRTKTEAKAWARNTEASIHEGRFFSYSNSKKKTMNDLIDRYIEEILPTKPASITDQTRQLNFWKREIGELLIQDVSSSMITALRNKLREQTTIRGNLRNPATVNRYLAALSHAFTVSIKEWEWTNDNPCNRVTQPPKLGPV